MDIQLHIQSVPIITKDGSSNPAHYKVYSIQHYVIQIVNDLRQVSAFLQELRFLPPIKLTPHDIKKILLKVTLNTITLIHITNEVCIFTNVLLRVYHIIYHQ